MSGDDRAMGEILDDIHRLSRGEAPQPRKTPGTPRVGPIKSALSIASAGGLAVLYVDRTAARPTHADNPILLRDAEESERGVG